MRKVKKVAWQARAAWMRFASMFKSEWTIDDYPIRVRFQEPTEPTSLSRGSGALKTVPWCVMLCEIREQNRNPS